MQKLLNGVKVVELVGLAPVPYCGLVLSDFGADVTLVQKKSSEVVEQRLTRGKSSIALDLRDKNDLKKVKELCLTSDVLLDPHRPGVLEKMGLDPIDLLEEAGHDINYVALSGMMPTISGKHAERPWPPVNLLADFAGGGLTAAFGIVSALLARSHNGGKGCVIDCSMVEGLAYLSSFVTNYYNMSHLWTDPYAAFSGNCPIYRTYKTKDGKFMAVGALEPKFHQKMFEILGIDGSDAFGDPEKLTKDMEQKFEERTRDEWTQVFLGQDACVTPVLEIDEVGSFGHHKDRGTFEKNEEYGQWIAKPAPRMLYLPELVAQRKSKI
ncbi:unnamed protein product [Caenorhabditis auriculariae]|uniref:Uncharacterized protein n=1 Tax=Caenorhabditis auriculariae TaxID=2777116 RepID=A0A8S1H0H6_9PELO|nr:unnamed protein product [Caenorhabditis auriculariae]